MTKSLKSTEFKSERVFLVKTWNNRDFTRLSGPIKYVFPGLVTRTQQVGGICYPILSGFASKISQLAGTKFLLSFIHSFMQTVHVHTRTLFDPLSLGPIHKIHLSEIYIYAAKVISSLI